MQHVFILLVAVPEANWQNDYSKINVKTKLFVNIVRHVFWLFYHTRNSLLFSRFASILNKSGLKFRFPDSSGLVKKKKGGRGGEICVPIQKTRKGSTFFPPSEMADDKVNRFIVTHIIRTAHNWFCVFSPGLTIYITTVAYFFSSSSWSTGGIDLCSDLKKEMAVSWTQLCSMNSARQLLWLIQGERTRKLVEDDKA